MIIANSTDTSVLLLSTSNRFLETPTSYIYNHQITQLNYTKSSPVSSAAQCKETTFRDFVIVFSQLNISLAMGEKNIEEKTKLLLLVLPHSKLTARRGRFQFGDDEHD